jgi:uracil-DNA glycosylase
MNWKQALAPVLASQKMQETRKFLTEERKTKNIYPDGKSVFRAFDLCPLDNTNVVILGSEPYNAPGMADGLCFSTKKHETPEDLNVIFKEIYTDLNIQFFHDLTLKEYFPTNNLEKWARNGFLMLNISLTVEEGKTASHQHLGWEEIAKTAIKTINEHRHNVLFFLWGEDAQAFEKFIDAKKHLVFKAGHPLSELTENGSFYRSRHFSIARDWIPLFQGRDFMPTATLDSCLDKDKAKEIIKEHYPIEAEKMCQYVDDLHIGVPINKNIYWKEMRNFDINVISTNYKEDE